MPDSPSQSSPLDRFKSRLWDDWAKGEVQPLHVYLEAFPEAESEIARAWLEHRGGHDRSSGSPGTDQQFGQYRIVRELG